jgi:hypothetical protein
MYFHKDPPKPVPRLARIDSESGAKCIGRFVIRKPKNYRRQAER